MLVSTSHVYRSGPCGCLLRSPASRNITDWLYHVHTSTTIPGGCSSQGQSMVRAYRSTSGRHRAPPADNVDTRIPWAQSKFSWNRATVEGSFYPNLLLPDLQHGLKVPLPPLRCLLPFFLQKCSFRKRLAHLLMSWHLLSGTLKLTQYFEYFLTL